MHLTLSGCQEGFKALYKTGPIRWNEITYIEQMCTPGLRLSCVVVFVARGKASMLIGVGVIAALVAALAH